MNRREIYTPMLPRTYDLLKGWRDTFKGVGYAMCDVLGGYMTSPGGPGSQGFSGIGIPSIGALANSGGITTFGPYTTNSAVCSGFYCQPAVVSSPRILIDVGTIYAPLKTDNIGNILPNGSGTPTNYGDISSNSDTVVGQFVSATALFNLAAPGSGSNWYAVVATPTVVDTTEADDPNLQGGNSNAVLAYYNSANPNVPFAGPSGSGAQQATVRNPTVTLTLLGPLLGTSTTLGDTTGITAVALPTGAIPLYYVQVITGQGAIQLPAGQIWAVGRSLYNYPGPDSGFGPTPLTGAPVAPFLTGLLGQHHMGLAGTAPQIDGNVEWKPLGTVPNNGQQITGVGQGGYSNNSAGALSNHLSDVLTVGQILALPGLTAGGSAFGVAPTFAAGNVTNLGAFPGGTTVTAGKYFYLKLYSGALTIQGGYFTLVLGGALTTGNSYNGTIAWGTGFNSRVLGSFFSASPVNGLASWGCTPLGGLAGLSTSSGNFAVLAGDNTAGQSVLISWFAFGQ